MLYIHASQVAACVGRHPYQKQHDAFERLWKRVSPHTYSAALARHGTQSDEDALREACAANPALKSVVDAAATRICESVSAVARGVEASRAVTKDLDPQIRKVVNEDIRKNLYCNFGTAQEYPVFETLQATLVFEIREDPRFYSRPLGEYKGTAYSLGGRIDGISTDLETVIEIKNRVNRLMGAAPEYERVQILSYFWLIPSAKNALLVENFRGELNVINVDPDPGYWDSEIMPALHGVVRHLIDLLESEELQDRYMQTLRKSGYLKKIVGTHARPPAP